MSENQPEIDEISNEQTVLEVDNVEKVPEIVQTQENKDIENCLKESEAFQSEIVEKQTETEVPTGNAESETDNTERNECPEVEATRTGEESKSDEVVDEVPLDVDKEAPSVDANEVGGELIGNGELDDIAKSDSEHEGEVEDLEEPEECNSSNEMIIGGDAGLIDSGSESRHHHKKNRRRIVVDESDESEAEIGREEILRSCTPENSKQGMSTGGYSDEEGATSEKDEKAEDSPVEIIDPEASELIAKEKPGPKSKKSSTYLKLEQEYETRHLFKNAIIIPAVEKKKKQKRVLASEDEDSDEKSREPDVIGIGIEEPMDDETSRLSGANILLSENYSVDPNFIPLEGVQVDSIPEIIPLENPILPQDDEAPQETEMATCKEEVHTQPDIKPNLAELQQDTFLNPDKSPEYGTLAPAAPSAPSNVTEFSMDDTSGAPTILADLSDNKAPQFLVIKKEPDLDQKASEQFLADALRAQFTDQAPTSIKKLEANTEMDMNTTFWGRDSSSSSEEDDWTNNMFNSSSKR